VHQSSQAVSGHAPRPAWNRQTPFQTQQRVAASAQPLGARHAKQRHTVASLAVGRQTGTPTLRAGAGCSCGSSLINPTRSASTATGRSCRRAGCPVGPCTDGGLPETMLISCTHTAIVQEIRFER
jgi:hypothetical protein